MLLDTVATTVIGYTPTLLCLGLVGYIILQVTYNLYFSPIRHYPGPRLYAATPFPRLRLFANGNEARVVHRLHLEYGSVVRIGPNELSFTDDQAGRDIYGHVKGRAPIPKDPKFYPPPTNGEPSILTLSDAEHGRVRRVFANAFSERALREQQPLIMRLVSMLVERLKESAAKEASVDLVKMYTLTT